MNLRQARDYTIGLDLGTGSVGWAVVDEEGRLYHFKGQPTWGSRLFPSADTAAGTRLKRGQRRRYARRRQRLEALQEIFLKEMGEVDPDFFIRLRQSRLLREDKAGEIKDYRWPLFNEIDFTEAEYYLRFPTIYHLRAHLMECTEKVDLRLVYLALHNIVKYRGNFLHEEEGSALKASSANAMQSATELADAITEYFTEILGEASPVIDAKAIKSALDQRGIRRSEREQAIRDACSSSEKSVRDRLRLIARACVGYKVDYTKLIVGLDSVDGANFSLGDEEKCESFADEICPDEGMRLFRAVRAAYSSYVLSGILLGSHSLSEAMIKSYEQHHEDLALLKALFKDHLPKDQYNEFFRGDLDSNGNYDINELKKGSYTSYVMGERLANKKGTSHEELIKRIKAICSSTPAILNDPRYLAISERIESAEESNFLAKQKTRENGAIPYQLHLEELERIIDSQGKYYPFLIEQRDFMRKLVSSRIPYYVGLLNGGHDPKEFYKENPVDTTRKYGWSVRREGKERAKAYPWNVDEVIDTDTTAELFIRRMTGTCSYLYGEPVLPRHSLLYEEFCVLNEVNGSKWCEKGGIPRRFDHVDKEKMIDELFKHRRSAKVSYKAVSEWLFVRGTSGTASAEVSGGQGETGYESKLGTYHDFCKIFGVSVLEDEAPLTMEELEEIVLWSTVFEDRSIFRRKLRAKYGQEGDGRLTPEQIKKIVNKRYTGWGRLSRRLLTGVRVPASVPTGSVSVMDVMRGGSPYTNDLHPMVLMEVLTDKDLDFESAIEERNNKHFKDSDHLMTIDDMQGSPANRRAVNQALRILDEIVHITGCEPKRICIEVTRDDDWGKKGRRTTSRYNQLKDALKAFKADRELLADLDDRKDRLDDDRLLLYFQQQGRCMYSGEPLDIRKLQTYQIDHVLPQSYIKDDSIDNRVLVKSGYNQRKLDSLLLDDGIINARFGFWKALRDAKLITDKKFRLLTCKSISDRQAQGFINRQLVETSQIVKFVRQMCEQKYPATEVVSVRANTSHGVRDNLGLVKCRELNNYHHAHDAFIACQVSDFIGRCYPDWQDGFKLATIRKYIKAVSGSARRKLAFGNSGFIADSLTYRRHIDERTGEVLWDHQERCENIRKALGYRTCFISRMTEIQSGAFWDETVYSPKDARNSKGLSVPLKSSTKATNYEGVLDPKKYGGVSSVKQAYWFVFVAKDKRGKDKFFFEGLPIYLMGTAKEELSEYAETRANMAGCSHAKVLRTCIPLRQKFELNGTPYYLYGSTGGSNEIRPALELYGHEEVVYKLFHLDEELTDCQLNEMYHWLSTAAPLISPKLTEIMKLTEREGIFIALRAEEKINQLKIIINKLNGTSQTVDMKALGGAPKAGSMKVGIGGSIQSITWVDQSVTGMFEKRTTFEDLCHGL